MIFGKDDMEQNKYSEWVVLTPILLVIIIVAGGMISFFSRDYLERIDTNTTRLYQKIADIQISISEYRIHAESRFSTLEAQVADIQSRISK